MRIIQIKKRFYRWCEETIELLKDALVQIEDSGQVLYQCHLDKDYTKNSVYRNMYPVLFCKIMLST